MRDVELFGKTGAQRHGRVLLQSPANGSSILSDTELFATLRFGSADPVTSPRRRTSP
jgi:hypothetical protein